MRLNIIITLTVLSVCLLLADEVTLKNGRVISNVKSTVDKNGIQVQYEDGKSETLKDSEVKSTKKRPVAWKTKEEKPVVPTKDSPTAQTVKNSIGMEFVLIPAGEFLMGCSDGDRECDPNENPQHRVKISKPFYLGKYEVTQGQWEKVMGSNPSKFKDCGTDCPVENVSWNETQNFIEKLCSPERTFFEIITFRKKCKYRLPAEAEWEYAARAGTNTARYGNLDEISWYDKNSGNTTHQVGKKKPNAFELYDMLGNVWEWTDDWYGGYQNGSKTDPKGSETGSLHVLRGGSWYDIAQGSRSSYRGIPNPGSRFNDVGFRLVFVP